MLGTIDQIQLPDGRHLEVYVSGSAEATPLVFHHGTPGGAVPIGVVERAAHRHGLRFVVAARPGYGESSRRPGRHIADVVADTDALLDALGRQPCFVAGWSGGGPHALACAARLPGVLGVVVFAGVAPHDAADLAWMTGMGEDNLEEFGAAAHGEAVLRALLEPTASALGAMSPAELGNALGSLLSDADRAALDGELGPDLEASMRAGIATRVDGWVDDDLAFLAPWGFDLDEVAVPAFVWQGSEDLMVPVSHGRWLGAHIPGVQTRILTGEGHLSIVATHVDVALGQLVTVGRAPGVLRD